MDAKNKRYADHSLTVRVPHAIGRAYCVQRDGSFLLAKKIGSNAFPL